MSAVTFPLVVLGVAVTAGCWSSALRASRRAVVRRRLLGGTPLDARPPAWLGRLLSVAEVDIEPERAWPALRGTMVLVTGWSLVVSPWPTSLGLVAVAVLVLLQPFWHERRARRGYNTALIGAVEAIVAALAGGSSLHQAVEAVSRRPDVVAADLRDVVRGVNHGRGLVDELQRWADAAPETGPALVANALALTVRAGGSHIAALQGVVDTLREREALRREVRALGSQARLSATVLVLTPVAFGAISAVVDPRVAAFVVSTPAGGLCVAAGLTMDAVAAWWMHRLTSAVT